MNAEIDQILNMQLHPGTLSCGRQNGAFGVDESELASSASYQMVVSNKYTYYVTDRSTAGLLRTGQSHTPLREYVCKR